jgi:hypothetical protein
MRVNTDKIDGAALADHASFIRLVSWERWRDLLVDVPATKRKAHESEDDCFGFSSRAEFLDGSRRRSERCRSQPRRRGRGRSRCGRRRSHGRHERDEQWHDDRKRSRERYCDSSPKHHWSGWRENHSEYFGNGPLKRFRAKACPALDAGWIPVRVKKTRQDKNLEPRSDSIGTEMALTNESLASLRGFLISAGDGPPTRPKVYASGAFRIESASSRHG